MLKRIRLVTFDATNTLLKFKVHPWEYYTTVGREYGFEGSDADLKPRMLNSYKIMWDKYPNFGKNVMSWEEWWIKVVKKTFDGQLPKDANIDYLAKQLIHDFKTTKCWSLSEDSHTILNIFRNTGNHLGVISNFDPRLTEILRNVNIYNKLDFVITSFDTGYAKPDIRIFEYACLSIPNSVQPIQCIHIGDDLDKDYKAAKAAGWNALLISNKTYDDKCVPKEHVFRSISQLKETISKNKLKL